MLKDFRSRLIAILVVINLAILLLGGASYFLLGSLGGRLESFTQGIYARLQIATRLRDAADARAIAVRNLALLADPVERAEQVKIFADRQAETTKEIGALSAAVEATAAPKEVRDKVASIAAVEGRYAPVAAQIVQLLQQGKHDEALLRIQKECTPTLRELTSAIGDYMLLSDNRTKEFVRDTEAMASLQRYALLAAAGVVALIGAVLGFLLRRNVRRMLGAEPEELRAALGRMAEGDLAASSPTSGVAQDSLLGELNHMRERVGSIVRQVRSASDSIATGSTEIANGNADLSRRTEEQAGSLQQTAATMEQLGSTVRANADSARQANLLAQGAADVASKGGAVVGRVVTTMQGISQSSRKIGDIIGVIDGIAFQTNILALNAAVEAARAGEQGRGFAVVASEVRTLARRSAEAAREIKTLIGHNVEQVEQGTSLVDEAGSTMDDIVRSIGRVSDIVSEISAASVEQSHGVQQVGAAVTKMDRVTQQNSALVEESASAAESLKSQAEQLVAAVSSFKLAEPA